MFQLLLSKSWIFASIVLVPLLLPKQVHAHEVYVLTKEVIVNATGAPAFSFIPIFQNNAYETIVWGSIVVFLILTVFFISISQKLETRLDPFLVKIKHFAPFIARVVAGLGFLACGYFGALFGPELPFSEMFGNYAVAAQILFMIIGLCFVFGFVTRIAAAASIAVFCLGIYHYGFYMLTYSNYFGEIVVLLLIGSHKLSIDTIYAKSIFGSFKHWSDTVSRLLGEYAFLILRVSFGFSLIYASVYAKFIHNQLALAVVNQFDLVSVFPFAPEFIVFGAAIIELLFGLFFILGIEIRFTSVMINVFLFLSLFYFGEVVWPHIILIGIPIAFMFYGYDRYSLEGYFLKKGNREPIF